MLLKKLSLKNFRNFKTVSCDFASSITAICGKNGEGKTSLLEAIFLIMTGTSFRTHRLVELIKTEEDGFCVEVTFEKEGLTYEVEFIYDGRRKRIFCNRRLCESQSVLIGLLQGVCSTPDIHELIKGPPQIRRSFLDILIAQKNPLFVHHLSRYNRALKQRNALLRSGQFRTISAWEQELSASASYITKERVKVVDALNSWGKVLFPELGGEGSFVLEYDTKAPYPQGVEAMQIHFDQEYKKRRNQEQAVGITLVGPHRDELKIVVNERLARNFASEGQVRLIAYTLKFAEWYTLKEDIQDLPLLLIDDFGAFLDEERCALLYEKTKQLGQVLISTHKTPIKENDNFNIIFLKNNNKNA